MVQAAGPAPVYIRVRQKTNRKKGVLPPAWSPTFRPTRTGAPVSRTLPRAAARRVHAAHGLVLELGRPPRVLLGRGLVALVGRVQAGRARGGARGGGLVRHVPAAHAQWVRNKSPECTTFLHWKQGGSIFQPYCS